jgi:hypothetical protein
MWCCVYFSCGDHLLVVICGDFSWKFCSLRLWFLFVFDFHCYKFPLVFVVVYGVVSAVIVKTPCTC